MKKIRVWICAVCGQTHTEKPKTNKCYCGSDHLVLSLKEPEKQQ